MELLFGTSDKDNKVIDYLFPIFINKLEKYIPYKGTLNIEKIVLNLWKDSLLPGIETAIKNNSEKVIPIIIGKATSNNLYIRIEHNYTILEDGTSTYINNLRLCERIVDGVYSEIIVYGVYCSYK